MFPICLGVKISVSHPKLEHTPFLKADVIVELTEECVKAMKPDYDEQGEDTKHRYQEEVACDVATKAIHDHPNVTGSLFKYESYPVVDSASQTTPSDLKEFADGSKALIIEKVQVEPRV